MQKIAFGRSAAALLAVAAALGLAACGGSSHDETPPATEQVPPSASASVDDFIDYLKRLVKAEPGTLEPVDTAAVTPPTTETAEPVTVD